MSTLTFAGARARFKINGQKVAYAGGVSGEEAIDYQPVDVLDLVEVFEHVPVGYRASLNANIFRVVGQSLKNLGIFPKNNNILTSGDLTAAIEDTQTGRNVYAFHGVKAATKTFDLSARALVTENVGFVAIRCIDESQI